MSQFQGVTVETAANVYFDGKVTSRTVLFPDGTRKTLGIMLPGDYEFGTGDAEIMEIQSGTLEVKLPGAANWVTIKGPDVFSVPAQSRFALKVATVTDYICSYVKG